MSGEESPALFALLNNLAYLFNARTDSTEGIESAITLMSNDVCQSSFAGTRRAPEDKRGQEATRYLLAQSTLRAYQMFLSHIFFKRSRTHTFCKWRHLINNYLVAPTPTTSS